MKRLTGIFILTAAMAAAGNLMAQPAVDLENSLDNWFDLNATAFTNNTPPQLVPWSGTTPDDIRAALLNVYADMLTAGRGQPGEDGWVWAHSHESQIEATFNGVLVAWGVGGKVTLSGAGVAISMGEEGGNAIDLDSEDSSSYAVVRLSGGGGSGYAVGGAGYSALPTHIANESFAGDPEHGGWAAIVEDSDNPPSSCNGMAWGGQGFDWGDGGNADVLLSSAILVYTQGGPADDGDGGQGRAVGGAWWMTAVGGPNTGTGNGGSAVAICNTLAGIEAIAIGGDGYNGGDGGNAYAETEGGWAEAYGGHSVFGGLLGGEATAIAWQAFDVFVLAVGGDSDIGGDATAEAPNGTTTSNPPALVIAIGGGGGAQSGTHSGGNATATTGGFAEAYGGAPLGASTNGGSATATGGDAYAEGSSSGATSGNGGDAVAHATGNGNAVANGGDGAGNGDGGDATAMADSAFSPTSPAAFAQGGDGAGTGQGGTALALREWTGTAYAEQDGPNTTGTTAGATAQR
jgi:hypothetical protein